MKWVQTASSNVVPFLLMCVAQGLTGNVMAADAGHGRVSMKGSIVETPCAIDVGSRDQTLYMGSVPISQIIRDGRGPQKDFSIRLVNCAQARLDSNKPDWQTYQITFDGDDDNGNFRTLGEARGVAMMIRDGQGNTAMPGNALPVGSIREGDLQLRYTLNLVGNRETLRAGDYRSAIRFRMDYY